MMHTPLTRLNTPNSRRLVNSIGLPFGFLVLCVLFDRLYALLPDATLDYFFHNPFVILCVHTINLISPGEGALAVHNTLVSDKANLSVVRTCDGSDSFFMIAAAILVFPASLDRKLWGLLVGVIMIMLLNFIRVTGLYFLMAYQPQWFYPAHVNFAPFVTLSVSCAYFAFWVYSAKKFRT